MKKYLKLFSMSCMFLSVVPMYYINTIPKNNFISGQATFFLFLIPLTVVQIFLVALIWMSKADRKKKILILSIANFIILILQFYILLRYDSITT